MRESKQHVTVVLHKQTVMTSTRDTRRGCVARCWLSVTPSSLHRVYALLTAAKSEFVQEPQRGSNRTYFWRRPINVGDYVYDARRVVALYPQLPVQAAVETGMIRRVLAVNGDMVSLLPVALDTEGRVVVTGPAYRVWRHDVALVHVDLVPAVHALNEDSMTMHAPGSMFAERAG